MVPKGRAQKDLDWFELRLPLSESLAARPDLAALIAT
jgi:hypothetical protein